MRDGKPPSPSMAARAHRQCEHYTAAGHQCTREGFALLEFAGLSGVTMTAALASASLDHGCTVSQCRAWTCGTHFRALQAAGLGPRVLRRRDDDRDYCPECGRAAFGQASMDCVLCWLWQEECLRALWDGFNAFDAGVPKLVEAKAAVIGLLHLCGSAP